MTGRCVGAGVYVCLLSRECGMCVTDRDGQMMNRARSDVVQMIKD